jgi:CheY-like chemotaxis protein
LRIAHAPIPLRFFPNTRSDDHHLNLRLCKRLLELQGGLEVSTADDGDVALQAMIDSCAPDSKPLDFVLMDLQARMPRALHTTHPLSAADVHANMGVHVVFHRCRA